MQGIKYKKKKIINQTTLTLVTSTEYNMNIYSCKIPQRTTLHFVTLFGTLFDLQTKKNKKHAFISKLYLYRMRRFLANLETDSFNLSNAVRFYSQAQTSKILLWEMHRGVRQGGTMLLPRYMKTFWTGLKILQWLWECGKHAVSQVPLINMKVSGDCSEFKRRAVSEYISLILIQNANSVFS